MRKFHKWILLLIAPMVQNHVYAAPTDANESKTASLNDSETVALYLDSGDKQRLTNDDIERIKNALKEKSPEEPTVKAYGLLQGYTFFLDTTRDNTPDFLVKTARLGLTAKAGPVSGQLEAQFVGNQAPVKSTQSGSLLRQSPTNTVVLRQAQINFEFFKHKSDGDSFLTRFSFGGIRVGGAVGFGTDAAYTPNGFARQDGAYIQERMQFDNFADVNLGFGIFNSLFAAGIEKSGGFSGWGTPPYPVQQSFFGHDSSSSNKAYFYSLEGTTHFTSDASLNIVAMYGFQNKAPVSATPSGYKSVERDADHFESSLWYNHKGIFGESGMLSGNGLVTWFETESGSNTKTDTGVIENSGYAHSVFGIGIAGDTSSYLTRTFLKGDRFTYGVAYTKVNATYLDENYSPNYLVNQVSASFGYGLGTFELAFVGAAEFSDRSSIARAKTKEINRTGSATDDSYGDTVYEAIRSDSKAYLTLIYAF